MEAVVGFEYLPGVNNDTVIKEVSIGADNIIQHNILNLPTLCIPMNQPQTVLIGTTATNRTKSWKIF
jgi:hypothetical protein